MAQKTGRLLASFLKNHLEKYFQSLGFELNDTIFVKRYSQDLAHVIEIQASRWSSNEDQIFTFGVGIRVSGVVSRYFGKSEREICDPVIWARIGLLADGHDKWWTLNTDQTSDEIELLAIECREKIETILMPFLENFRSVPDVARALGDEQFFSDPIGPQNKIQRYSYAALVHNILEQTDQSKFFLKKALDIVEQTKIPGADAGLNRILKINE